MSSDMCANNRGDIVLTLDDEASDLMKKILDEYNAVPGAHMTAAPLASMAVKIFYGIWTKALDIVPRDREQVAEVEPE